MVVGNQIIIKYGSSYLMVEIDKGILMYGFSKNTWINSIVLVSAEKLAIHLLVQLYQCKKSIQDA